MELTESTEVGEYFAQLVVDAMVPAINQAREERDLIAATIDAYLGTVDSHPDLYRVLIHESGAPGIHHLTTAAAQTVATHLTQAIGERFRALGLDAGPAEPWAYGMVGLLQTAGDWWITCDQPIDRATLTGYLTTLLAQGIAGVRTTSDTTADTP